MHKKREIAILEEGKIVYKFDSGIVFAESDISEGDMFTSLVNLSGQKRAEYLVFGLADFAEDILEDMEKQIGDPIKFLTVDERISTAIAIILGLAFNAEKEDVSYLAFTDVADGILTALQDMLEGEEGEE